MTKHFAQFWDENSLDHSSDDISEGMEKAGFHLVLLTSWWPSVLPTTIRRNSSHSLPSHWKNQMSTRVPVNLEQKRRGHEPQFTPNSALYFSWSLEGLARQPNSSLVKTLSQINWFHHPPYFCWQKMVFRWQAEICYNKHKAKATPSILVSWPETSSLLARVIKQADFLGKLSYK